MARGLLGNFKFFLSDGRQEESDRLSLNPVALLSEAVMLRATLFGASDRWRARLHALAH